MLLPVPKLKDADFIRGAFMLVNKPKGWTSFDVVHKIRNLLRHKYQLKKIKVGHSGTLDPMATGLLLVCTGALTKELFHLQGLDKKYQAEITLGIETNTYDAEGEIVFEKRVPQWTTPEMESILSSFLGETEQIPPAFSAIKKEGKPLYKLARSGKEVTPEPRKVELYKIKLMDKTAEKLYLFIHCGSGFYVRSLAHDIGEKLGCGAHLSGLTRTGVGDYKLEDAWNMDELIAHLSN